MPTLCIWTITILTTVHAAVRESRLPFVVPAQGLALRYVILTLAVFPGGCWKDCGMA